MSSIRQVSLQDMERILASYKGHTLEGHAPALIVLHHTSSPTAAQYKGAPTWEAIRTYHMQTRGWRDIAYHLGIGPDGTTWLLRPVTMTGGSVHDADRYGGVPVNDCGVAVAMVGDYNVEDPELVLPAAVQVMAIVCRVFGLDSSLVFFHRDWDETDCPGSRLDRDHVRSRIHNALLGQAVQPPVEEPVDVSPWALADVAAIRNAGLMTGYPDGTFRGRQPVTREELAVALRRLSASLHPEADA